MTSSTASPALSRRKRVVIVNRQGSTSEWALAELELPDSEDAMISVRRLGKREDGQDLLEYGLLASLIAIFAMAAVRVLSDQITNVLWASIASNF